MSKDTDLGNEGLHLEDTHKKLDVRSSNQVLNVGSSKTPHRCPVCYGKGLVPNGFYNTVIKYDSTMSTAPETCRSCNGTGIVWG